MPPRFSPEDVIKHRLLHNTLVSLPGARLHLGGKRRWEESRFHSVWPGYFHGGLCERQIPWDRLSEGGGISCLLKCDRIVTEVKMWSMPPFSPVGSLSPGFNQLMSFCRNLLRYFSLVPTFPHSPAAAGNQSGPKSHPKRAAPERLVKEAFVPDCFSRARRSR